MVMIVKTIMVMNEMMMMIIVRGNDNVDDIAGDDDMIATVINSERILSYQC